MTDRLPSQIVLMGPMCIGKSTIAQILSDKISRPIVALDDELSDFTQLKAWEVGGSSIDDWQKLRREYEAGELSSNSAENYSRFKVQSDRLYEPCLFAKFAHVVTQRGKCILDTGSNLQIQSQMNIQHKLLEQFDSNIFPVVIRFSHDTEESFHELFTRFLESSRAEWLDGGVNTAHWQNFLRKTIEAPLLVEVAKIGIEIYSKNLKSEEIASRILHELPRS